MPDIWKVAEALWSSDLSSFDRHIAQTLLLRADKETAVVSYDKSPSLTTLAKIAGCAKSAASNALNRLEKAGWVKRNRPDVLKAWANKERTQYTLLIPTSPRGGLVLVEDQSTSPLNGLVLHEDLSKTDIAGVTSPPGGLASKTPISSTSVVTSTSSAKPPKAKKKPQRREDVERICQYLADKIEGNGSRRPTVSEAWRDEARLLLDKDGRTVEQVIKCIDWCQNDLFWRKNVLSMPKLRERYDQLRLAALEQAKTSRGPRQQRETYRDPEDRTRTPNTNFG